MDTDMEKGEGARGARLYEPQQLCASRHAGIIQTREPPVVLQLTEPRAGVKCRLSLRRCIAPHDELQMWLCL
jgi:hypothetical protein